MKKLFYFLFSLFLLLSPLNILASPAHAAGNWKCSLINPPSVSTDTKTIDGLIIDTGQDAAPGNQYFVYIDSIGGSPFVEKIKRTATSNANGQIVIDGIFDKNGDTDPNPSQNFEEGSISFFVTQREIGGEHNSLSFVKTLDINKCDTSDSAIPKITVDQGNGLDIMKCKSLISSGTLKPGDLVTTTLKFADTEAGRAFRVGDNQYFDIKVTWPGNEVNWDNVNWVKVTDLEKGFPLNEPGKTTPYHFDSGTYTIIVHRDGDRSGCKNTFVISKNGGHSGCFSADECTKEAPYCSADLNGIMACQTYEKDKATNPCAIDQNEKNTTKKDNSFTCLTAIGPIRTSPTNFITNAIQLVLGLGGGILLLFLIINGYRLMASQGDPEKVKEARESIVSAIAGLLLVIFSIALLQLITVDILGIPGFTK